MVYGYVIRHYVSQPYSLVIRENDNRRIVAACINALESNTGPHQIIPRTLQQSCESFDQSIGLVRRALGAQLNQDINLFLGIKPPKYKNRDHQHPPFRLVLGRLGIV